jgi:geranylgeranyl diphosphate synthase type I
MSSIDDLIDDVIHTIAASIEQWEGFGGGLVADIIYAHLGYEAHKEEFWCKPTAHGATGKMVRPRLCLLACQAVGGDPEVAVGAAAAVEMIHNYTLIHDDIEDRDEMRRGRPTVWKLYGEAQAINAGDYLHSLAYSTLMVNLPSAKVGVERKLRVLSELTVADEQLCAGQAHDIALQSRDELPSEDEYLDMVTRKTGALMNAAASMGALLGGGEGHCIGAFGKFGERLGVAFQIRDDVLGIWGDPEKTGKPAGADLTRKRCSYPVVWASARAEGKDREALLGVRGDSSATAVANAVAALERLGAREGAEGLAAEMHRQAWAAVEGLKLEPQAEAELRQLTEFLTIRER